MVIAFLFVRCNLKDVKRLLHGLTALATQTKSGRGAVHYAKCRLLETLSKWHLFLIAVSMHIQKTPAGDRHCGGIQATGSVVIPKSSSVNEVSSIVQEDTISNSQLESGGCLSETRVRAERDIAGYFQDAPPFK